MKFKFMKYFDESRVHMISNCSAEFYGSFVICSHDEHLISLKSNSSLYSVYGSNLYIAVITKPRIIIKGKIERIDFI